MRREKIDIRTLDTRVIIINLYITQAISLILAFVLSYFLLKQNPIEALSSLTYVNIYHSFLFAILFSLTVVSIDVFLTKKVPKEWIDDGGINEKLFRHMSIWHIGIIAIIVGFVEEFLFRYVIQSLLGVFFTSVLFTFIHFRYLNKYVLILSTFFISVGLGYLAIYLGWFTAFFAHTFIDFILGVMIRKKWLLKE